ncbi:MAG: hypothetical protein H0W39_08295 [Sphingomonas sp.]|nr:hypothetical protein [Sphingomonas sp.]
MRKQVIENAAYEVATQVRAVEESMDGALAEIAELQARVLQANSVAGVGFATVHPTLQQLAAAVTSLVDSRGAVLACHAALADARTKVPGLRTVSWGDGDDCPEVAKTDLRIVA